MPDKDGELSNQERDQIIEWLVSRKPRAAGACEACGSKNWVIGSHLTHAPIYIPGRRIVGGVSYPLVMAVCGNCTNTRFFMANAIGILEDKLKEKTLPEAENG